MIMENTSNAYTCVLQILLISWIIVGVAVSIANRGTSKLRRWAKALYLTDIVFGAILAIVIAMEIQGAILLFLLFTGAATFSFCMRWMRAKLLAWMQARFVIK